MITPLQHRLLTLLMLDPGARAGRLRARLIEAKWNPRPTPTGIARSLGALVEAGLVRRVAVPEIETPTWRYSLTDKGVAEVTSRPRGRKVA